MRVKILKPISNGKKAEHAKYFKPGNIIDFRKDIKWGFTAKIEESAKELKKLGYIEILTDTPKEALKEVPKVNIKPGRPKTSK